MFPIKTILHPTDFWEAADQALELAYALARDHGAKLVLVAVPQPPANLPTPVEKEFYLGLTGVARRELKHKAAKLTDVPVDTQVLSEPVGPAIVAVARDCQADLIVMATHGRTGVKRLLLGSVAEHVLRHASCPVLTVKPGASAPFQEEAATPTTGTAV
jgi:nucleotide-binding universal stress UspA family protein